MISQDGCRGVVAAALADDRLAGHRAARIADHDDHALVAEAAQERGGDGGQVSRGSDAAALRLGLRLPYEMEGGDDPGGLRGADTGDGHQAVGVGAGQPAQVAAVGDQVGGELDRVGAPAARADQQGEQLPVGQRGRPPRQQSLTRLVVRGTCP